MEWNLLTACPEQRGLWYWGPSVRCAFACGCALGMLLGARTCLWVCASISVCAYMSGYNVCVPHVPVWVYVPA
jgi:hypothetical protein